MMDIAATSVVMANQQVRSDAGLAVMRNVMDTFEQQGVQLMEMLEQPSQPASHPSLGSKIDLHI
ncbi:YjfB family protein [Virgibacillus ainsalahensis]